MADNSKVARDQSTIQFPYVDLDESIKLASVILTRGGGMALDRDQLADGVGQVPNSGAFGAKVGAAKMFGLIDSVQGKYTLTDLGFEILDAARERAAKAKAFLNVPLYKRMFDDFRGRQLPPRPHGLEQAFASMGVAKKQKERARQIFDRSARSAGYFSSSTEDRLVSPVIGAPPPSEKPQDQSPHAAADATPSRLVLAPATASSLHPFIEGLLKTLPSEGEAFPVERRAKWLELAANAFDMIYGQGGEILIAVQPDASGVKP